MMMMMMAVMMIMGQHQSIYNEDANQWAWTPEVGIEMEVLGPFESVAEAMACAQESGGDSKAISLPYPMELVQLRIKDKKFVKIVQGKEPSQVCLSVYICVCVIPYYLVFRGCTLVLSYRYAPVSHALIWLFTRWFLVAGDIWAEGEAEVCVWGGG